MKKRRSSRSGIALVAVLGVIVLLSVAALSFQRAASGELQASYAHLRQRQALFQAEAGVRYVMAQLSSGLRAGTLPSSGSSFAVNYAAPSGYTFDTVTQILRAPNGAYSFVVTGRTASARVTVEVTLQRPQLMANAGVFGDGEVELYPGLDAYSYNSLMVTNPLPAQSTGEVSIGSNLGFKVQPGVSVDGQFLVGAGTSGTSAGLPPSGFDYTYVGRMNPDPLDISSTGSLGRAISYHQTHNNNASVPAISANQLSVKNNDTITMTNGIYYLTSLSMGPKNTLVINATPEKPVVIFMDGGIDLGPKNIVNQSGRPGSLYIFSRSSSQITIAPNSGFDGFVYAPDAHIQYWPGSTGHGVLWAKTVDLHPNGVYWVDMALLNMFLGTNLEIVHWREL